VSLNHTSRLAKAPIMSVVEETVAATTILAVSKKSITQTRSIYHKD